MIGIHKHKFGDMARVGLNIGNGMWFLYFPLPFSRWGWDYSRLHIKAWTHLHVYIGRYTVGDFFPAGERFVCKGPHAETVVGFTWTVPYRTPEQETLWGLLDLEQPKSNTIFCTNNLLLSDEWKEADLRCLNP